jgi:hypothetical protein
MGKSHTNAMECPICFCADPTYVINCGSTTEHKICDTCEVQLRMKSPATRDGRVLKCPMCRGEEKVPGKRTAFSYEYELSQLYAAPAAAVRAPAPVRVSALPVRVPVVPVRVTPAERDWAQVADSIRDLPRDLQERYIRMYPRLRPYFEIYDPLEEVIDLVNMIDRQPFAAQVAPANRAAMRPPSPVEHHAFCQSGNREAGACRTRGKTERKCSHPGCAKFVCRSCRQCLTH